MTRAQKSSPKPPTQYRQGDVLITRIGAVPAGLTIKPRDNGRVILAYGEVTGHAHAIADTLEAPAAALFDDPSGDGSFVMLVEGDTGLVHEEHGRIDLPAGNYRVTRQREYTPEAIRNVAD
jgi:hypothetical protein